MQPPLELMQAPSTSGWADALRRWFHFDVAKNEAVVGIPHVAVGGEGFVETHLEQSCCVRDRGGEALFGR